MVLVCSLGSGSSGNATLVRGASGRTILIDCGVQYPRLVKNLARLGVRPAEIDVVYLSHEHSDHIQAARPLHELWGVPIIASRELRAAASWLGDLVTDVFDADQVRTIGDMTVIPRAVAHDAAATYGFRRRVRWLHRRVLHRSRRQFGGRARCRRRGGPDGDRGELRPCDARKRIVSLVPQGTHQGPRRPPLERRLRGDARARLSGATARAMSGSPTSRRTTIRQKRRCAPSATHSPQPASSARASPRCRATPSARSGN